MSRARGHNDLGALGLSHAPHREPGFWPQVLNATNSPAMGIFFSFFEKKVHVRKYEETNAVRIGYMCFTTTITISAMITIIGVRGLLAPNGVLVSWGRGGMGFGRRPVYPSSSDRPSVVGNGRNRKRLHEAIRNCLAIL